MKQLLFWAMALSVMLLVGCGRDKPVQPPSTDHQHQQVKVLLFVAPWCHNCRQELPVVNKMLPNYDQKRIFVEAWVETGFGPDAPPRQADADEMKATSGATFDFIVDEKVWGAYRNYYANEGYALPAAVVLANDETCTDHVCKIDNSLLRKFYAPFDPQSLLDYAKNQLN